MKSETKNIIKDMLSVDFHENKIMVQEQIYQ